VLKVVEATPFNTQSYLTTPVQVWPGSTVMLKSTFRDLTPVVGSILVGASNRFGALRLTLVKPASCKALTLPKSKVIGSAFTAGTMSKNESNRRDLNIEVFLLDLWAWDRSEI
jgi:hypothetical protein